MSGSELLEELKRYVVSLGFAVVVDDNGPQPDLIVVRDQRGSAFSIGVNRVTA